MLVKKCRIWDALIFPKLCGSTHPTQNMPSWTCGCPFQNFLIVAISSLLCSTAWSQHVRIVHPKCLHMTWNFTGPFEAWKREAWHQWSCRNWANCSMPKSDVPSNSPSLPSIGKPNSNQGRSSTQYQHQAQSQHRRKKGPTMPSQLIREHWRVACQEYTLATLNTIIALSRFNDRGVCAHASWTFSDAWLQTQDADEENEASFYGTEVACKVPKAAKGKNESHHAVGKQRESKSKAALIAASSANSINFMSNASAQEVPLSPFCRSNVFRILPNDQYLQLGPWTHVHQHSGWSLGP